MRGFGEVYLHSLPGADLGFRKGGGGGVPKCACLRARNFFFECHSHY